MGVDGGGQRAEAQDGIPLGVDDAVQAYGISHAVPDHQGGVEEQAVGGGDPEPVHPLAHPGVHEPAVPEAPGDDQREVRQVAGGNRLFPGQGAVPAHEDAPGVADGKLEGAVLGLIHGVEQQAEVDQPLVQLLRDIGGIAAGDMEADMGVPLLEALGPLGEEADALGLARADVDVSGDGGVRGRQLASGLFYQVHDLSGALAEEDALLGQGDAAVASDKQGLSQLLLQVHQLAGQGGLGEVQAFRRAADALLTGYREEVTQDAQFHRDDLLLVGRSSVLWSCHNCQVWRDIQHRYLIF